MARARRPCSRAPTPRPAQPDRTEGILSAFCAQASRTGRTPSQLAGNKLFDSDPDDFVKGRPNEADLEKNSQGNAGYYASVFTQCLQLHMSDEGMYELMVDPSIGKMAAELAGVQGIRIWHDQALIKEPWANPTVE